MILKQNSIMTKENEHIIITMMMIPWSPFEAQNHVLDSNQSIGFEFEAYNHKAGV